MAAALARHGMLPPPGRVLAAVSGGSDSVFLAHALTEEKTGLAGIVHVNHALRGQESDEDEAFVRSLAHSLDVPFYVTRLGPASEGNLEQNLSRARKRYFQSLIEARQTEGRPIRVALGHTKDDQAETVLFRILRGSGISGLAGILPVTAEGLIRPLLDLTREEIRGYLRSRSIPWREDSSNSSSRFARNRLRNELLPQLTLQWNPQLRDHLAQLADLSYQEERWWTKQIAAALPGIRRLAGSSCEIDVARLASRLTGFRRRLVRECLREVRGHLRQLEFQHIDGILSLAASSEGDGRLDVPGVHATRSFGWIRLSPAGDTVSVLTPRAIPAPGLYALPSGSRLRIEEAPASPEIPQHRCDRLKVELLADHLELRGWRPGDQYRPWNSQRPRKLADLFQESRIPSWRRPSWPILIKKDPLGDSILWARGFGVSGEFMAGSGGAVRITEENLPAE